ncbi:MAG: methyltransferase domain-containing protein [Acidobacteriota bacterium]|nr:methyltransferase domain-containing protein [Acidobacteriota bacterium]MDE2922193.1 methyltransferase domain-containing protein [Acidobacteriota bacterium]MDE3265306.1 methyltransferase domain-containing protein [Acidobacteriota bacterium]
MNEEPSHSVRRHLRIAVDEYDTAIRQFIPGYEEMLAEAARALRPTAPGLIIDLGAGTGALSEAILDSVGGAVLELIDVDSEMLNQARTRLARFGDRARFTEGSFLEPLPRCAGAAASLALHHIPAMDGKRRLYGRVFEALEPGGIFVNADATMPSEPNAREATWRGWADHLVSHGIDEERAFEHFEEWSEEDTYFPLEDELAAIASAGFAAECVWHEVGITVVVGRKPG